MTASAKTLLDAATATGTGPAKHLPHLVNAHTIQVVATGSPTAVTIALEGSLNNISFAPLVSHAFTAAQITASIALVFVVNAPVTYIRANLTTLTGGTAPTITCLYEGDRQGSSNTGRVGQF